MKSRQRPLRVISGLQRCPCPMSAEGKQRTSPELHQYNCCPSSPTEKSLRFGGIICQAIRRKIFCFTEMANQVHNSHRPGPPEDVSRSSRCVGPGMRWPPWRQVLAPGETFTADGEVVWFWRRDPGVYPARLCGHGNGDNKGRSPGRARISRKAIARGMY